MLGTFAMLAHGIHRHLHLNFTCFSKFDGRRGEFAIIGGSKRVFIIVFETDVCITKNISRSSTSKCEVVGQVQQGLAALVALMN
jgi:hypothetical protein